MILWKIQETGEEKATLQSFARKSGEHENEIYYESNFEIPDDFGEIGAVKLENEHRQEMFVKNIALDGFPSGIINIHCDSWIHSQFESQEKRVFFSNTVTFGWNQINFTKSCTLTNLHVYMQSYLPSETPSGLVRLREKDLVAQRGDGEGERKASDRIYDYDVYNDLGDPDADPELARPVLGGPKHPYPRRCRTGRPRTKAGTLPSLVCHSSYHQLVLE